MDYELYGVWVINAGLVSASDVNWWTGVLSLSALILTAPIHCSEWIVSWACEACVLLLSESDLCQDLSDPEPNINAVCSEITFTFMQMLYSRFLHCFTLYSTDQFMHSLGIEPMTSALLAPWSTVWEEPATETQDNRPADVLINTSARVQSMQKHFWIKKLKGNCVFVSHGQTFVSQFWDINSKLLKLLVYCYFHHYFILLIYLLVY